MVSCLAAMLPNIWYGGKFFFVGYAYDGHGPQNQLWTCSRGFHVRQRCCPKYGTSQKFCIVPFWLVGRPSAGVLLPNNFVLFPSGLLASLRPASSFPKILYCSLLTCWPAFGRLPHPPKFCTGAKFFFVVSGKIASQTSLAAGGLWPLPARSVGFAQ